MITGDSNSYHVSSHLNSGSSGVPISPTQKTLKFKPAVNTRKTDFTKSSTDVHSSERNSNDRSINSLESYCCVKNEKKSSASSAGEDIPFANAIRKGCLCDINTQLPPETPCTTNWRIQSRDAVQEETEQNKIVPTQIGQRSESDANRELNLKAWKQSRTDSTSQYAMPPSHIATESSGLLDELFKISSREASKTESSRILAPSRPVSQARLCATYVQSVEEPVCESMKDEIRPIVRRTPTNRTDAAVIAVQSVSPIDDSNFTPSIFVTKSSIDPVTSLCMAPSSGASTESGVQCNLPVRNEHTSVGGVCCCETLAKSCSTERSVDSAKLTRRVASQQDLLNAISMQMPSVEGVTSCRVTSIFDLGLQTRLCHVSTISQIPSSNENPVNLSECKSCSTEAVTLQPCEPDKHVLLSACACKQDYHEAKKNQCSTEFARITQPDTPNEARLTKSKWFDRITNEEDNGPTTTTGPAPRVAYVTDAAKADRNHPFRVLPIIKQSALKIGNCTPPEKYYAGYGIDPPRGKGKSCGHASRSPSRLMKLGLCACEDPFDPACLRSTTATMDGSSADRHTPTSPLSSEQARQCSCAQDKNHKEQTRELLAWGQRAHQRSHHKSDLKRAQTESIKKKQSERKRSQEKFGDRVRCRENTKLRSPSRCRTGGSTYSSASRVVAYTPTETDCHCTSPSLSRMSSVEPVRTPLNNRIQLKVRKSKATLCECKPVASKKYSKIRSSRRERCVPSYAYQQETVEHETEESMLGSAILTNADQYECHLQPKDGCSIYCGSKIREPTAKKEPSGLCAPWYRMCGPIQDCQCKPLIHTYREPKPVLNHHTPTSVLWDAMTTPVIDSKASCGCPIDVQCTTSGSQVLPASMLLLKKYGSSDVSDKECSCAHSPMKTTDPCQMSRSHGPFIGESLLYRECDCRCHTSTGKTTDGSYTVQQPVPSAVCSSQVVQPNPIECNKLNVCARSAAQKESSRESLPTDRFNSPLFITRVDGQAVQNDRCMNQTPTLLATITIAYWQPSCCLPLNQSISETVRVDVTVSVLVSFDSLSRPTSSCTQLGQTPNTLNQLPLINMEINESCPCSLPPKTFPVKTLNLQSTSSSCGFTSRIGKNADGLPRSCVASAQSNDSVFNESSISDVNTARCACSSSDEPANRKLKPMTNTFRGSNPVVRKPSRFSRRRPISPLGKLTHQCGTTKEVHGLPGLLNGLEIRTVYINDEATKYDGNTELSIEALAKIHDTLVATTPVDMLKCNGKIEEARDMENVGTKALSPTHLATLRSWVLPAKRPLAKEPICTCRNPSLHDIALGNFSLKSDHATHRSQTAEPIIENSLYPKCSCGLTDRNEPFGMLEENGETYSNCDCDVHSADELCTGGCQLHPWSAPWTSYNLRPDVESTEQASTLVDTQCSCKNPAPYVSAQPLQTTLSADTSTQNSRHGGCLTPTTPSNTNHAVQYCEANQVTSYRAYCGVFHKNSQQNSNTRKHGIHATASDASFSVSGNQNTLNSPDHLGEAVDRRSTATHKPVKSLSDQTQSDDSSQTNQVLFALNNEHNSNRVGCVTDAFTAITTGLNSFQMRASLKQTSCSSSQSSQTLESESVFEDNFSDITKYVLPPY